MKHALIALPFAAVLAGCNTTLPRNMPLIFSESITVGIGIGATTADQGADFTLGVKTRDVAIIPVVAYDEAGKLTRLHADNSDKSNADKTTEGMGADQVVTDKPVSGSVSKDAFSVLGVFSSDTSGSSKTVGIGKFFATGTAAQRLADGFSACLGKNGCSGK